MGQNQCRWSLQYAGWRVPMPWEAGPRRDDSPACAPWQSSPPAPPPSPAAHRRCPRASQSWGGLAACPRDQEAASPGPLLHRGLSVRPTSLPTGPAAPGIPTPTGNLRKSEQVRQPPPPPPTPTPNLSQSPTLPLHSYTGENRGRGGHGLAVPCTRMVPPSQDRQTDRRGGVSRSLALGGSGDCVRQRDGCRDRKLDYRKGPRPNRTQPPSASTGGGGRHITPNSCAPVHCPLIISWRGGGAFSRRTWTSQGIR